MIERVKKIFHRKLTSEEKVLVEFMKKIPLFTDFSDLNCAEFVPFMYERHYKKDEVVFFRNDAAQAVYLVKKGSVELALDTEDRDEYLFTCHDHTAFGINALIKDRKRDFNAVVTSEKATLIVIPQSDIFNLFDHNDEVEVKMLTNMALHYDQMFKKLFEVYRNNIGFFELKNIF